MSSAVPGYKGTHMLDIHGLCVRIGAVQVLRSVDVVLPVGTMTGLFGRNGAGKTSLLRSIMGALKSEGGSIKFDTRELTTAPAHLRAHLGIGYMPEDRKLVPQLTCRDNIQMPLYAGVPVDKARLDWSLEIIPEIKPLLPRRANQLSGGQQKMVALARAFVAGSHVLLLDEPTEGVAPVLAARFSEILTQLKGTGLTLLIAESDSRYLKDLVDRSYDLERGEATLLDDMKKEVVL